MWINYFAIFCAGGVGAWCRWTLDAILKGFLPAHIPASTFLINLLGSFALGLTTGLSTHVMLADAIYAILAIFGVGFLGGFTTFSTALVEVVATAKDARPCVTLWLLLGQCLACVCAAFVGLMISTS